MAERMVVWRSPMKLRSAVRKNDLEEFLFPYASHMLMPFLPFKCTDFVKCQGIINNPLHATLFF